MKAVNRPGPGNTHVPTCVWRGAMVRLGPRQMAGEDRRSHFRKACREMTKHRTEKPEAWPAGRIKLPNEEHEPTRYSDALALLTGIHGDIMPDMLCSTA